MSFRSRKSSISLVVLYRYWHHTQPDLSQIISRFPTSDPHQATRHPKKDIITHIRQDDFCYINAYSNGVFCQRHSNIITLK